MFLKKVQQMLTPKIKSNLNNLVNALRFIHQQNIDITIGTEQYPEITIVAKKIQDGADDNTVLMTLFHAYHKSEKGDLNKIPERVLNETLNKIDSINIQLIERCKLQGNNVDMTQPTIQALIAIVYFAKSKDDIKIDRRHHGGDVYSSSDEALGKLKEELTTLLQKHPLTPTKPGSGK